MARDRPSPYGERKAFFIVARGPSDAIRASERVSPASVGLRGRWRGTGPRPTMKGAFCRRAPGRRAALLHRDQEVSPTGETESFEVSRNHFDNNEI